VGELGRVVAGRKGKGEEIVTRELSSAEKAAWYEMLSTDLKARKDQQLLSTSHRYCIKPTIFCNIKYQKY